LSLLTLIDLGVKPLPKPWWTVVYPRGHEQRTSVVSQTLKV